MRVLWSVLAVIALSATEASAANWNEGTMAASDGLVDQLERAAVWQREIGEPQHAPIVLAEARKPAKRGSSGAASVAFDGRWSVVISTRSGSCDPQYRFRCADHQRGHYLRGGRRGQRSGTGLIQRWRHN